MAQIQDDGFHEIQLNGKQLVFLFMAATVVSVVIFLCGVLVGRGVRAERTVAEAAPAGTVSDVSPAPPQPMTQPPPPASAKPAPVPTPAPADDKFTYFDRLEKSKSAPDQLKGTSDKTAKVTQEARAEKPSAASERPASEKPASEKPATEKLAPDKTAPKPTPKAAPEAAPVDGVPAATPSTSASASPADAEPAGQGFAVQIAALNVRSEADAIAKRLTSKGYAAYVLAPPNGTPSVFRVRVGKFNTRREAESVAAKLQREEQFKPWVTR